MLEMLSAVQWGAHHPMQFAPVGKRNLRALLSARRKGHVGVDSLLEKKLEIVALVLLEGSIVQDENYFAVALLFEERGKPQHLLYFQRIPLALQVIEADHLLAHSQERRELYQCGKVLPPPWHITDLREDLPHTALRAAQRVRKH